MKLCRTPSPRELSRFSRAQVTALFKKAHRVFKTHGLTILSAPTTGSFGRILVVTPAATGTAPQRNKMRRQLKALFYEQKLFMHNYDFIFIMRKEACALSFQELEQLLQIAIKNAHALIPHPSPPEQKQADLHIAGHSKKTSTKISQESAQSGSSEQKNPTNAKKSCTKTTEPREPKK